MKRSPLVITGTACGLVAVIGYHTAVPQASASTGSSVSSASAGATLEIGGSSTSSTKRKATRTATAKGSAEAARTATGTDVQYQYGDIELRVTMTGGKITDVTIAREDITDPHSQQIDQYALPQLRSEALAAQSANIDGVSGASYTSAAYEQSLQSAIDKLKA